ncbi:MAG: cytochrome c-type biosis protein CcmH [Sphingomonadales bacterium]|nr:cytochrome c-type biosis protein CcmH [Sphingomonadales bacterium]
MAKPPGYAATIALAGAGLIALAAVGVAIARSGGSERAEAPANVQAPAATPEAMIAEVEERLRRDPDNDQGWFNLGILYREARRFPEAERAFRRAMELRPRNADYVAYLGETLLLIAGRDPPPEAEALFRRALALDPANPQAHYYLATLRDHRGDHSGAVEALLALLRQAPAGAPWEPQVREAAVRIAEENGIDIAGRLPPPPRSTATAGIPGPTRAQIDAARAIPPGQQDAMVKGMVDRLAGRLRQNPRDAEGWIRLMRSRMVLNEPEAAAEALRSGLAAFRDDAATQQRLRTAAQELGITGG